MRSLIPCILLILIGISSCSDKKKITGKDLMPEMLQTDSIQVIYFRSPDETRFFTFTSSADRSFINFLVKDVTGDIQPENACMKEGKIYCYKKGEVFNTIFFAYIDDECAFLRYIKNGNLYHFKMSDKVKSGLVKYRVVSVEPTVAQ